MNYTLQGNTYADTYSFLLITVNKWSGMGWKSTNEIISTLSGKMLTLAIVNTYFDLNDYNNPVKTYIDDQLKFSITSGYSKSMIMSAQQRTSIKSDDFLYFWNEASTDNFVGVESYTIDFQATTNTDNSVATFLIRLDPVQQQYTRSVYNFLQFSGDLGGVFQVLEIIGGIVVGIFAQKLFKLISCWFFILINN